MVFCVRSCRLAAVILCLLLLGVTRVAYASASLLFNGYVQTLNTGGSITLVNPSATVVDTSGDIFVVDTGNNQIVEVNAQGAASVLTTGALTPALSSPTGLAIDGSGNLYVADTGNSRVVEISSSGVASVVGTGSVTLSGPKGVALDQSGDILISDTGNNRIVEVTSGGSAAALSITVSSGPSSLNGSRGLTVDPSGNIFIADTGNNRVVKVAAGGTTGVPVSIGELEPALSSPSAVVVDRIGNILIADTGNNRIVEVDKSGFGTPLLTFVEPATTLNGPLGVAIDVFGTVYIADTANSRVLIVDPTLDGDPYSDGYALSLNKSAVGFGHITLGSSTPTALTLSFVIGSPVSGLGGVHVFTSGTQGLDFQIVSGENTTCSSSTTSGATCSVQVSFLPTAPGLRTGALVLYDPDQNPVLTLPLYGWGDAPVAALSPNTGAVVSTGGVPLNFPFQLALDGAGNIYDANDGGNVVKIPAGGGNASVVSPNGQTFGQEVTGVALDGAGNLFVSDHTNNRIIVITPGGVTSVLSIAGLTTGLNHPTALAFDGAGNLYISDWTNGRVVEVSSLFVAGSTSSGIGTVIGTGSYNTASQGITGVAVDSMGNIYIPDGYAGSDPSRVIKVTAAGVVSLLTPTGITFSRPRGVSADGMGNVYVADGGHNRIVEITTAGVASVLAVGGLPSPTILGSPFGVTVDPSGNLYIPDSGNNRALFVNVSGSALTFPNTATGATSAAKTATVTNLGNQSLIFSTNPTYTANFSANSADTNPCTSSSSLLAGTNCDVSVLFTPQSVGSLSAGITVTNNTLNVGGSTEQVSVSGTGFASADVTSTTVTVSPTSLANGQTLTITAVIADTTTPSHTPTGSVAFTDTLGSTTIALPGGSAVSLVAGTARLSGVLLHGVGTHTITATYSGVNGSYATSTRTVVVVVSLASVTVTGPATQPVAVINGQTGSVTVTVTAPYNTISAPSGTLTYTILNSSNVSVASGTITLTAGSGSSTATVSIPNTLAPGNYTISVTYSGDGNYSVSATAITIQLQIGQITPAIAIVSSLDPVLVTYAVTFTATVSSTAGAPTGSVNFFDGTTLLASVAIGQAEGSVRRHGRVVTTRSRITAKSEAGVSVTTSYTTSALAAGSHSITAVYSGDSTFASATSSPVVEVVQDFSLASSTPGGSAAGGGASSSQTVLPGATATYNLALGPINGVTFPVPVTMSVSGLPPGATATISPQVIPAGAVLTNIALTVQLPMTTASLDPRHSPNRGIPPALWGILLLPFAGRLRRARLARAGQKLSAHCWLLLLLGAGIAATVGLSGCGSGNGFFGQQQGTYTLTVTASAGAVSHSTTVTLTVE